MKSGYEEFGFEMSGAGQECSPTSVSGWWTQCLVSRMRQKLRGSACCGTVHAKKSQQHNTLSWRNRVFPASTRPQLFAKLCPNETEVSALTTTPTNDKTLSWRNRGFHAEHRVPTLYKTLSQQKRVFRASSKSQLFIKLCPNKTEYSVRTLGPNHLQNFVLTKQRVPR